MLEFLSTGSLVILQLIPGLYTWGGGDAAPPPPPLIMIMYWRIPAAALPQDLFCTQTIIMAEPKRALILIQGGPAAPAPHGRLYELVCLVASGLFNDCCSSVEVFLICEPGDSSWMHAIGDTTGRGTYVS